MLNDLRYRVGSREIVDLFTAMRNGSIILSPYFQRNLVWRDTHKRDFIDTILKGYPFPQIFLARGPIDLETMKASQAVVDGQQRLNTISEYLSNKLDVHGSHFKDLSIKAREEFLKYEVAVIDFDLDVGDPRLKDIFHRLNRTYYSLSAIEKLASEYSASEFMLVARVLSGEIEKMLPEGDDFEVGGTDEDDDNNDNADNPNIFGRDPGIDDATWGWLIERADGAFANLVKTSSVFTPFEFERKVPLMFSLNVMCTFLTGYYERNNRVRKLLDEYALVFPEKQEVLDALNETAEFINAMKLPSTSPWWTKSNFFTIIVELARQPALRAQDPAVAGQILSEFGEHLPDDYMAAAKEAVGRKPQRELRGRLVRERLQANDGI